MGKDKAHSFPFSSIKLVQSNPLYPINHQSHSPSAINHRLMKSSPLATGVSKVNYTAFLFAAFFTIGSFPFVAYCLIPLVVDKFGYTKEEAKSILSCFVAIDQVVNIAFGSVWVEWI